MAATLQVTIAHAISYADLDSRRKGTGQRGPCAVSIAAVLK
jgi:hypothetical protein